MKVKERFNGFAVKNSNDEKLIGKLFSLYTLGYFRKKFYKGFYKEHLHACKDIVISFLTKNREDKNHTILYAPTQAGKTSCMTLLTNIISEADFKRLLNINLIIYLTGDNQCGLANQSRERFENETNSPTFLIEDDLDTPDDYIDDTVLSIRAAQEDGEIPVLFIKQSDCKKAVEIFNRYNDFFKDTLVMIDESHYGTKSKKSQVNMFLESIGCDLANSHGRLLEQNIYILSVSATPWNELFSDEYYSSDKNIVRYQTGQGYKGFSEFIHNNNLKGIEKGIDNVDDFRTFLGEQYKKIKRIKTNPGKAVIFRINDKGIKLPEKELKKIIGDAGFNSLMLTSSSGKISYEAADDAILAADKKGKPIVIVVYEGYKHGISIDGIAKKEVVTVYDFRKGKTGDATDATEQGLLGRMCGYDEVDLNNLEIIINKTHYDGLLAHNDDRGGVDGTNTPTPIFEREKVIECSKEEWKRQTYSDGKDKMDYVLIKRVKNLTFKIDEFIQCNIDKYGRDEIKSLLTDFENRPKRGIIANIIRDYVREAVADGKIKVDLKDSMFIDGRRMKKTKDSFTESLIGDSMYIHNNNNRKVFTSEKIIDKGDYAWGGVINSIGKNGKPSETGVTITIAYGEPVYAKRAADKVSVKRKLHDAYEPVPMYKTV